MSKDNKIIIILTGIKERFLTDLFSPKTVSIALSVWILSLTAYYCINTPWLGFFSSMRPDTKQLIGETLKFQWIPVFLSRLPYVFYALILNFIALLMGNRILRWLKVDFDSNLNRIIFSLPLGWGIYSIGIFYLGISGLLYKEAVYCFLTLLGILSILEIKRFFKSPHPTPLPLGERIEVRGFKIEKTDLVFLPIIIIFIAIQLVISFSPVWSNDALVYHMALPKLYIKHHALIHVPGFFFSTLPAHTEMLYLLGLITSGETLSKLFSFSISLFMILESSIHSFFYNFSEPFVDAALGLFSLLGIYAFFMWMEDRSRVSEAGSQGSTPLLSPPSQGGDGGGGGMDVGVSRLKTQDSQLKTKDGYLYLSITCCALAAATKIQGLFFVLLFFASFLITVRMDRQFLKKLAWCILTVCIIALPWYIRSWWLTENPVFPFLYNYFGGKYWNEYSNACFWEYHSLHGSGGAKSFSDFIRINKNLFSFGFVVSPLSPIIVIFLIPALIAFRNWNKLIRYLFLATLAYYIFFIFTAPVIRYFYVGLAILSIIAAYFIKTVWTKFSLTRIPILCIVIFSIISFFGVWGDVWKGLFFTGLGVLDRRQFLNESHLAKKYLREHYRVAMWVNEGLPQDSKILTWHLYGYHLDRQYLPLNPIFQGVLDFGKINDTPTFLKNIKELGITHLLFCEFDITSPRGHVKEFLNKCVSELLEEGKIAHIKQIDSCAIYSVEVPPDYFVLNNNTIGFRDESQRKYLARGWSSTEGWGTWSEGEESVILVNFTPTLPSPSPYPSPQWGEDGCEGEDYTMLIKATGFSVPGKQQSVKVYLDDNFLGKHTFIHPTTYFEDIEANRFHRHILRKKFGESALFTALQAFLQNTEWDPI